MKIEVEDASGYKIVRLSGELDRTLREATDEVVHPIIEKKSSRLLIDLSGVQRINSEGLGAFVTLVARANSKGSRIVFASPLPFVKAILDTTQLTKFLETEDTIDAAVDRLLKPIDPVG